ncbi:histone-like nucleoid-structuring protein Lsr2 [Streptomyces sp. NPDC057909]|uniref:Lsr2 family DNA-binding protein n=1 Tax=Streptomyces sp. NPDC057909 TaxID=3346277 RepID=UPI0036F0B1EB
MALSSISQGVAQATRVIGTQPGSTGSGPTTPNVAEVRVWAREQGMDVPPRGRLRAQIWNAWNAAHPATSGHDTALSQ